MLLSEKLALQKDRFTMNVNHYKTSLKPPLVSRLHAHLHGPISLLLFHHELTRHEDLTRNQEDANSTPGPPELLAKYISFLYTLLKSRYFTTATQNGLRDSQDYSKCL
jgi:hypothetical protein